jgi:hypothetical protein
VAAASDVAKLFADPQFSQLAGQVVALVGALARRADALGTPVPPEMLIPAVSSVLADATQRELAAASSGAVVSLKAVRQARAPAQLGYITLTPDPAAFAVIDTLAKQLHREVNAATRSLVLQSALQQGLEATRSALC